MTKCVAFRMDSICASEAIETWFEKHKKEGWQLSHVNGPYIVFELPSIKYRCHDCIEIIEFDASNILRAYTCKTTGSLKTARADHLLMDGTYCDSEQEYRFSNLW